MILSHIELQSPELHSIIEILTLPSSRLKDLSDLLVNPALAQSEYGTTYQAAIENLSNSFYSYIPHAFGRNRPPIIGNDDMLKKEVDLLDSLSDMKEASNIMKNKPEDLERLSVLDRQFKGLNLDEMTPLKHDRCVSLVLYVLWATLPSRCQIAVSFLPLLVNIQVAHANNFFE
jgi:hypothetical protein